MAQFGAGGSGGTIDVGITPFIPNPKSFLFINGNSGVIGTANGTSTTASATNANVGVGGTGSGTTGYAGGAGGGAGGAGAYIKVVYNGGQISAGTVINYNIGAAGGNGTNGGIKITWT
jgi:hypothetical protein